MVPCRARTPSAPSSAASASYTTARTSTSPVPGATTASSRTTPPRFAAAARVLPLGHLQRRRAGAAHRSPLPAAELASVLLRPAAREARRNPLRRALPRRRGLNDMAATSAPAGDYLAAPNRVVSAGNGIDYAYRQVGEGTPALVLLQHFRGNLDNWDPALVDALGDRRVVTFDDAGVAGSTGTTPSTIAQMARDGIAFLEAVELGAVDLLGFSIGSFVAHEI